MSAMTASEVLHRCEHGRGLVGRTDEGASDEHDRRAVELLGHVGQRRDAPERDLRGDRVRARRAPRRARLRSTVGASSYGYRTERAGDVGAEGVQLELEGGDHPEPSASTPCRPEQVGVLVAAGGAHHPLGGHDLDGAQVVAAEPVGAHHHAEPAAEGEASDAGGRHLAAGGGEAVDLRGPIDIAPSCAGLDPRRAARRVDLHRRHGRQVDHEPVVAHATACHLMAATPDAHHGPEPASDPDRLDHIGDIRAAGDHRRMPVDQPVPHPPGTVVVDVVTADHLTAQRPPQLLHHLPFDPCRQRPVRCHLGHGHSVASAPCTALERLPGTRMAACRSESKCSARCG